MIVAVTDRPKRILALTKYGDMAASTRQRLLQFLPALAAADYQVDTSPFFDNSYLVALNRRERAPRADVLRAYMRRLTAVRSAAGYDAVWLAYESFPYLPGFAETLLLPAGMPVVLDFDDAIFHQYDSHRLAPVRALLGRKLQGLMRRAAVCTPGNAYLAAYAERFCHDVRIIPTVVDTAEYRPPAARSDGVVTIGWIGSPTTWAFVEPLVPHLQRLAARPDVRIKIVGAGRLASKPDGIEFVDWSEDREVAEIQSMDIGVMPLPDEPFARGKCGYKLIQYGACGLPVVASPVGVNTEIVVEGETGFLADKPEAFVAALARLLADKALRERQGAAGRARVVELYSLAAHEKRFVQAFDDIVRRPCAA